MMEAISCIIIIITILLFHFYLSFLLVGFGVLEIKLYESSLNFQCSLLQSIDKMISECW